MSRTFFLSLPVLIFAALGVAQGCGQLSSTSVGNPPTPQGLKTTVLTSNATNFTNGESYPYQLLKIESPDGFTTYAQWSPPTNGKGPTPVVVVANPYDGIDWSGDPIDLQWSQ